YGPSNRYNSGLVVRHLLVDSAAQHPECLIAGLARARRQTCLSRIYSPSRPPFPRPPIFGLLSTHSRASEQPGMSYILEPPQFSFALAFLALRAPAFFAQL